MGADSPRQAVHLTWDVAPSWYFHAIPSTHLLWRKQSQGVFLLSASISSLPEHRAFNLCLRFPFSEPRSQCQSLCYASSGLLLALTLE